MGTCCGRPRIVRVECLCCCREVPPWRVRTCARGHTTCSDCRRALGRPGCLYCCPAPPPPEAAAAAERARRGALCRVAQSLVEGAVGSVVAVVLCGCSVVAAGYAGKCCLWVFLRVCGFDDPGWFDWRVSKNIVPEGLVFGWVVLLGWLFCCYRPARARS